MRHGYNILKTMPVRILYTINNLHTAGSKLVLANMIKRLDRTKFDPVIAVNRKYGVLLERELEKISKVLELPLSAATQPRMRLLLSCDKSNNVPSILKMSDGKILATRNEGRKKAFGTALVEAMVARLPAVATKSGGPEEIVVNNVIGWLVDANNPEALAVAMREFYKSPKRENNLEEPDLKGQKAL